MENRFGVKDVFLCTLLIAIIVLICLAMKQYDRQWEKLDQINTQIGQQTNDLASIRRSLEQGLKIAGTGAYSTTHETLATNPADDPFARMKAATTQPGFAPGDWLVQAFSVNVGKLTPVVSTDVYAADVQNYVLESLAQRDPVTLTWQPLLASSFTVSPDGLTIKFEVRPDVTFSDGVPMTVDDIVYSYQMIMDEKIDAPRMRAYYSKITSVEKTGDWEVTFHFKEPYFDSFGLAGGLSILPKHFYEKYTPAEFNQATGLLMGTGPYRLADPSSWKPGTLIQLFRNERYWGTPGAFNRLVFQEVNNEAAQFTLFRNGEIDLFHPSPKQYQESLKDADLMSHVQHFEYEDPSDGYHFIGWNEKRDGKDTRFSDRRVRQAMTMLTDRQRIIDQVLLGYAVVACGPFHHLSPQHDPDVKPLPFDPQKAGEVLKEVGYTVDANGVLKDSSGASFEFKLTYPAGHETIDREVKFLKDDYARAGIIMDLEPLDWSIFDDRLKHRNFDAIMLGWGGAIESDIYQEFDSSQIADDGDNFISYSNPALDTLIGQARREVVDDKRMPLWHACEKIVAEDQPYTFLTNSKSLVFIDGRIHNIQIIPNGLNPSLEWWVPASLQKYKQ